MNVGLDKVFPNVSVESVFVTGLGETAFTGPLKVSSAIINKIIVSRSSKAIQLTY
jgi:hypothetical protein